jgi:hypothetical protein
MRTGVHIPEPWNLLDEKGKFKSEKFDYMANLMLDQLVWWTTALKNARKLDK